MSREPVADPEEIRNLPSLQQDSSLYSRAGSSIPIPVEYTTRRTASNNNLGTQNAVGANVVFIETEYQPVMGAHSVDPTPRATETLMTPSHQLSPEPSHRPPPIVLPATIIAEADKVDKSALPPVDVPTAEGEGSTEAPPPKPEHAVDKTHRIFQWIFIPLGVILSAGCLVLFLLNDVSAHTAARAVAGYSMAFSILSTVMLIGMHLSTFTKRNEQRFIIRILLMCPIYAVDSYVALQEFHSGNIIAVVRDTYEGYVIFQFFRLLMHYGGGEEKIVTTWIEKQPTMKHLFPLCFLSPVSLNQRNFENWKWMVSQYTLVNPLLTLITIPLYYTGNYEEGNMNGEGAYIYIAGIRFISVSLALGALVYFLVGVEPQIEEHKPEGKFLAVKAVVFATFWQSVLFAGLTHYGVIEGREMWTAEEVSTGLNNFIICIEMAIMSIIHRYVFSDTPYLPPDHKRHRPRPKMLWKLIIVADVFRALKEDLFLMPLRRLKGEEPRPLEKGQGEDPGSTLRTVPPASAPL